MKQASYKEVLAAYCNPFHEFTVEPVSNGLINHSYIVTSDTSGSSFLLQQINHTVFKDPVLVQENYELVWNYLKDSGTDFFIPEPKEFTREVTLYCDSNDNYWRVFEYIYGTETLSSPGSPAQAKEVAAIFGRFTSSFDEFDIDELNITIPGFHNLSARYDQFERSLKNHQYERLQKATSVIGELRKRERYANLYDVFTESSEFLQRVMHHDAKIGNVLFDIDSGKAVCPVDFDTTMPGYFFSDLGDMIRSMASTLDENDTSLEAINIRKEYYEAIIAGYLEWMEDKLTEAEKKYIHPVS
ncbi:MAG: aminoglycoside phosphotransferase family protein, partial [Chitinophagaceae bacterium]